MASSRIPWGTLLSIVLLGLAVRLDVLFAANFGIDADEAIVGLMAKHIAEGRGVPVFYYGQDYMGSLEALLVSPFFFLFGSSAVWLKCVPLLCSLLLIVLLYLLGERLGGKRVGLVASFLGAIPPAPLVVWSAKARGGFIEVIVLGALALLLALDWLRQPTRWRAIAIGLLLGLGWWTNNQIVFFMLPIGLAFLWGAWRRMLPVFEWLVQGALATAAFLVGSAPFWVENMRTGFRTFQLFQPSSATGVLDHLTGLFSTALPIILGGQRFWSEAPYLPGLTGVVLGFAGVLLLVDIGGVLRPKREERVDAILLCLLFVLGTCAVFAVSSFGWLVTAPRYLLPLYVGLLPLFALAILRMYEAQRAFGATAGVLLVLIHLASLYYGGRGIPGEPMVYQGDRVSHNHAELISWLRERSIRFVRTNYWIGYRLAFETDETVQFSIFAEPHQVRIPEYEAHAKEAGLETLPFVLSPKQGVVVAAGLHAMGVPFERFERSGYDILLPGQPPVRSLVDPSLINVELHGAGGNPRYALDNNIETRWGSSQPQSPGMTFSMNVQQPIELCGVMYDLGGWPQDEPRSLRISLKTADGVLEPIVNPETYRAVRYVVDRRTRYPFRFDCRKVKSVLLEQLGEHPVFDWSMAEVELLRR